MKNAGFFIGFFLLMLFLAMSSKNGAFIGNGRTASSTSSSNTQTISSPQTDDREPVLSQGGTSAPSSPVRSFGGSGAPATRLTDAQIEQRLAALYRDLDSLKEDLREQQLKEPASPYAGMVTINAGYARTSDPKNEYLILRAPSHNTSAINTAGWYVESYVTGERVRIPEGIRLQEHVGSRTRGPILLQPGDQAYLHTGESPIDMSFHENRCTGYLKHEGAWSPSLYNSCPYPKTEMEKYGSVALDDDSCYDFIERVGYCEEPENDAVEDADLSRSCERFIDTYLNYDGCVTTHKNDPLFDNVGYWRLYADRSRDLWRSEREIIRLMDSTDRVVDVIEY